VCERLRFLLYEMASECVYIRLWGAKSTDQHIDMRVNMPRANFVKLISGKYDFVSEVYDQPPAIPESNDQGDTTKFCTLGEKVDLSEDSDSSSADETPEKTNLQGIDITIHKQPVLIQYGEKILKYLRVTGLSEKMIRDLDRYYSVQVRKGKPESSSHLLYGGDVGDFKEYLNKRCCGYFLDDLTDPFEKPSQVKPLELSEDSDDDSDSDESVGDTGKINLHNQGIVIHQDKVKIRCGLQNREHFVIEGLLHVQRRRLEEELNISLLQKSEEKQSWYFPCDSQDDIEGILDDTYYNYRLHVADPTVEEDEVLSSKVAVFHSCTPNPTYHAVTGVSSYTCTKVLYLSDYKKGIVGDKLRESLFGRDSKFSYACHSSKIKECEENLRKEGFAIEFCECNPKIADDDKLILSYTLSATGCVIHTSLLGKETRFFETVKKEMETWSFKKEEDIQKFSKLFPPGRVTPSQQSRRVAVIHECIPTKCYIGVSGDISEDVIRTHSNWQLVSGMNLSTQKVMVGDARNIKFIVAIGCGHEFVENQLTRHGYDVKWCRKEGTDECVKFAGSSSGKSSSQESFIAKGETCPPKICPRMAYKGTVREKKCIQPVYRRGMCKNHFQKKYWYMKAKKPATKA
jgi:hypothetical protein